MDAHTCLTKPHRPPSSILIGSLCPPTHSESCEGKSVLGMFEVKENLKNGRDYKQTNMPLAVITDWTLFSCQCFLFNVYTIQYVDTCITFTIKRKRKPHTHTLSHTLTYVHMSQLLFLTLMPSTLSLSLSLTHIRTIQGQSGVGGVI